MSFRIPVAIFGTLLSWNAFAVELKCAVDPNNRQHTCFDPKRISSNGELRAVALYRGGPNSVEKTSFTMVVYCDRGFIELRDRQGVVFARDQPQKLHIVTMREELCNLPAKMDKKLN